MDMSTDAVVEALDVTSEQTLTLCDAALKVAIQECLAGEGYSFDAGRLSTLNAE